MGCGQENELELESLKFKVQLTLVESYGLFVATNVSSAILLENSRLTGSFGLGGSKRTLDPAVLGTYAKPISVISCSGGRSRASEKKMVIGLL